MAFRSTPAAAAALHALLNQGVCRSLPVLCGDLLQGQPLNSGVYVTSWLTPLKSGDTSTSTSTSSGGPVVSPAGGTTGAPTVAAAVVGGPASLPLHEIPLVAIKVLRKSGAVCRESDKDEIRRAVTGSDTKEGVWPRVAPGATSLDLVTQYEEVSEPW
jgi:hypothetical protein